MQGMKGGFLKTADAFKEGRKKASKDEKRISQEPKPVPKSKPEQKPVKDELPPLNEEQEFLLKQAKKLGLDDFDPRKHMPEVVTEVRGKTTHISIVLKYP